MPAAGPVGRRAPAWTPRDLSAAAGGRALRGERWGVWSGLQVSPAVTSPGFRSPGNDGCGMAGGYKQQCALRTAQRPAKGHLHRGRIGPDFLPVPGALSFAPKNGPAQGPSPASLSPQRDPQRKHSRGSPPCRCRNPCGYIPASSSAPLQCGWAGMRCRLGPWLYC